MTLKSVLKVMGEATYLVTIHWFDDSRDWYEMIIMDYLAIGPKFYENLEKRKLAESLPNKVTYVRYNTAYEMVEIAVEVRKGGAKCVNRKRAS